MKIQTLALTLAAGMAMAVPALASDRSENATFCAVIGLSHADQISCEKQLTNSYDRSAAQADWVARGTLIEAAAHGNIPALGNSPLDGMPATVYQNNGGFISNRVVAQVQRAVNTVLSTPALARMAATESASRRR